jgi:DNA-binding NarL/FixJ family response regulator
MSPPHPHSQAIQSGARHVVHRPRESDGVGNALRQIFTGAPTLPNDLASLLRRLPKDV